MFELGAAPLLVSTCNTLHLFFLEGRFVLPTMSEELYDEFGNYIGPELDSSSEDESSDEESEQQQQQQQEFGDAEPDEDVSDLEDDEAAGGGGGGASGTAAGGAMVEHDGRPEFAGPGTAASAIVLHEDKEHYPSAGEVYGPGVTTAVLDEDALDLDVPIVEPLKTKTFSLVEEPDGGIVSATVLDGAGGEGDEDHIVSEQYVTALLGNDTTLTRRGVALIGHLHAGKTTFVDLLLEQTKIKTDAFGERASMESQSGGSTGGAGPRITDTLVSEQSRGLSIKSTPITLCLPDTRGKSYAVTVVDCPGHPNFHDESAAALKCADGAVLAVDAVDGIMMSTEMVVTQAISEGLPLTLLITKVDRLLVELKLPPDDAYYKLRRIIGEVNALVRQKSRARYPNFDPAMGNVAFASGTHGWCFTLESFANQYLDHLDEVDSDDEENEEIVNGIRVAGGKSGGLGRNLSPETFAARLWGDCYLDPATRAFQKKASKCDNSAGTVKRTFVTFILEPLYKMYTACLGEEEGDAEKTLRSVGVLLSRDQLRSSARPLLRAAFRRFFGPSTGFVDMVVRHM